MTPADVIAVLRKRWDTGVFLVMFARGQDWQPLGIPIRGPTAGELASRFADARAWATQWERAGESLPRIESKRIGGRAIGSNDIPDRLWVDTYDQLWSLLRVGPSVRRLTDLADATARSCPRLAGWLAAHPMTVLRLQDCWTQILATVRWIDDSQRAGMYLREVDVPGVDTKFIERHRGLLADLLDLQLDGARIDTDIPRTDFVRRYGFRGKPDYVRFRLPAASSGLGGFTELSVRCDELTAVPAGITTVYVIENEITYLAFPLSTGMMAIFGSGYGVSALRSLNWLSSVSLSYWGDLDTHGFAILDRLRASFPSVRSMLMDRETLLAHRSQWVTEPSPARALLTRLDTGEAALYRDLSSGEFGPAVRLEQERIRFSVIETALGNGSGGNGGGGGGGPTMLSVG
jgi:hypothetical protein